MILKSTEITNKNDIFNYPGVKEFFIQVKDILEFKKLVSFFLEGPYNPEYVYKEPIRISYMGKTINISID